LKIYSQMSAEIPKPVKKALAKEVVVFEKRIKKPRNNIISKNSVCFRYYNLYMVIITRCFFYQIKRSRAGEDDAESNEKNEETISFKQAKFEVFKFGIKGFDKEQQENAKIQLAMKLGAKVKQIHNLIKKTSLF
jgi:hypothetical protein